MKKGKNYHAIAASQQYTAFHIKLKTLSKNSKHEGKGKGYPVETYLFNIFHLPVHGVG